MSIQKVTFQDNRDVFARIEHHAFAGTISDPPSLTAFAAASGAAPFGVLVFAPRSAAKAADCVAVPVFDGQLQRGAFPKPSPGANDERYFGVVFGSAAAKMINVAALPYEGGVGETQNYERPTGRERPSSAAGNVLTGAPLVASPRQEELMAKAILTHGPS